ncbi:MAG: hypothetical protein P0S93_03490 [Candidatus Neptunochlamydia sp.]|nr:hypothetical protein [Candidatus Neptunochlamydia sp.]
MSWNIYKWLEGAIASNEAISNMNDFLFDLDFVNNGQLSYYHQLFLAYGTHSELILAPKTLAKVLEKINKFF